MTPPNLSPNRRIFTALCMLGFLALYVYVTIDRVAERYERAALVQEARMRCEARGGYYGSARTGAKELCHEETERRAVTSR